MSARPGDGWAERVGEGEVGLGEVRDEKVTRGEVLRGDDRVGGQVLEEGPLVCAQVKAG